MPSPSVSVQVSPLILDLSNSYIAEACDPLLFKGLAGLVLIIVVMSSSVRPFSNSV